MTAEGIFLSTFKVENIKLIYINLCIYAMHIRKPGSVTCSFMLLRRTHWLLLASFPVSTSSFFRMLYNMRKWRLGIRLGSCYISSYCLCSVAALVLILHVVLVHNSLFLRLSKISTKTTAKATGLGVYS